MTTQLVTIEQSNQIIALSTDSGIKDIVQQAKEAIHNLDGGSMETATGRKKIRSNAFKATKLKTSLKEKSDELIESIETKIAPELKIIKAIKDNQKILGADLDKLRKDVNLEVDAHEQEIKRIEEEKQLKIEAEMLAKQIANDEEVAILMDEKFDRDLADEKVRIEEEEKQEEARLAKEKIDNDARIAKEAAEQATIEAERLAQLVIDDAQKARQKAIADKIKADNEVVASNARAKLLEDQAKQAKLDNEWLVYISEAYEINMGIDADRNAKIIAQQVEGKRIADIETAKQTEIKRQQDELKAKQEAQAKIEADTKHVGKIRGEIKNHLISTCGLDDELAIKVVKALLHIDQVTINY